jgi:hypothetical protein
MSVQHNALSGAALHPSKALTFTGSPTAFTPTQSGVFYVRTDVSPEQLYRSTGTGLGNLTLIGGGVPGTAATLSVGDVSTVTTGNPATVTNVGTTSAAVFDLEIPEGQTGAPGAAATIAVGTVTTGAAGSSATVTNAGSPSAATFNFTIPRGNTGATGTAATIAVGTVTTGAAGSGATVTNVGSPSAATFNFTIPRGNTGSAGGIALTFDTGTSAGAGSGEIRFNNAAIASTTNLFISETDADGAAIEAILASLSVGSQLILMTANSSANKAYFAVSGAVVDNGSDRTVPVTYQSHTGSFADGAATALTVSIKGATGSAGATGSVSAASSINFTEQSSDPSTPAAGTLVLFADSADRKLYTINSSGSKAQVGSGAEGGDGEREVLTANRTYYVRSDGNNSNSGLTNTAGGAFLTIQKAIDVLTTIDGGGLYEGIIKVRTGTYTTPVQFKQVIGFTRIIIEGDPATPSNVVVSTTNNDAFGGNSSVASTYQLRGLKIQTTGTGHAVNATFLPNIFIEIDRCDFGPTAYSHMIAGAEAVIQTISNYSISGGGNSHAEVYDAGYIRLGAESSYTVGVTGTPAFAFAFAYAARSGRILAVNQTYVGSATGQRFNITPPSIITVVGGSGTFPGNVAGTTAPVSWHNM